MAEMLARLPSAIAAVLPAMVQADGTSALSRIDPGILGNRDAISGCPQSVWTTVGDTRPRESWGTTWSRRDCLRTRF
jgi:hypothetical protein